MEEEIEDIKKKLKKYSQEHLLNNFKNLSEEKQKRLLEQIENIDFDLIKKLYDTTQNITTEIQDDQIKPIDFFDKEKLYDDYKKYKEIGEKAIRTKKLAAVTMAGGMMDQKGHMILV